MVNWYKVLTLPQIEDFFFNLRNKSKVISNTQGVVTLFEKLVEGECRFKYFKYSSIQDFPTMAEQ